MRYYQFREKTNSTRTEALSPKSEAISMGIQSAFENFGRCLLSSRHNQTMMSVKTKWQPGVGIFNRRHYLKLDLAGPQMLL